MVKQQAKSPPRKSYFELIMTNRGWEAPVAEVYAANETANGELGYYIVADGGPVTIAITDTT